MYTRILVPVDGSETSTKALSTALQLAREGGARLRLIHALDELAYLPGFEYPADLVQTARETAAKVLADGEKAAESAGVKAEAELLNVPGRRLGDVVAEDARNWKADLIVIGTHGRRGLNRVLLGSGAEQIVRTAPVAVLTVRA